MPSPSPVNPPALTFNGVTVRDRGEMLSLTDLWRAGGEDPSKRPYEWARKEGAAFITHMVDVLNTPQERILTASRGRGGSTFAHWQIALAYAKYLSPQFHAACNVIVRERMEGRKLPAQMAVTDLTPEVRSAIGGIVRAVVRPIVHEELTAALRELLPALVREAIGGTQFGVVRGLTAGAVLTEAGVTERRGLRGLSRRVSDHLRRLHAQRSRVVEVGSLGFSTAYMFDPDLCREWLASGGKAQIDRWIGERRGQGTLKLVQGRSRP